MKTQSSSNCDLVPFGLSSNGEGVLVSPQPYTVAVRCKYIEMVVISTVHVVPEFDSD